MNSRFEVLSYRIFSEKDQIIFANLSGDYNPIHINDKEAKKSPSGGCIVHGINSFLWVLEAFLGKKGFVYSSFKVKFLKPITLNKRFISIFDPLNLMMFIVDDFGNKYLSISINSSKQFNRKVFNHFLQEKQVNYIPNEININQLSEIKKINLNFNGDKFLSSQIFPLLSKKIGSGLISQISSISEIVGMQLPGKYSIFGKLLISFRKEFEKPSKVKLLNFNDRIGVVELGFNYKNIDAVATAYFRPKPFETESCRNISFEYDSKIFSSVKALIIGGSRGIGSCVAKLIALGGGESIITYCSQKEDAITIKNDIINYGSKCEVMSFDINKDNVNKFSKLNFNQIYYFATPKIIKNESFKFDDDDYKNYLNFYVISFAEIVKDCLPKVNSIFYPSTIFIDTKEKGFDEYIKAKVEGEKLCTEIAKLNNIKMVFPRLPKIFTDQTNSILFNKKENNFEIIKPFILEMIKI